MSQIVALPWSQILGKPPFEKRSWVDRMTSHVKPESLYTRWASDLLECLWLYPNGKSIYTLIAKAGESYVISLATTATHSISNSVVQRKNYTTRTGVWSDAGGSSSTSEVGATVTLDFLGTGIDIRHYADHRGGIWSFVLDGTDPYVLDTYVPSGGPVLTTRLITGLEFGWHRLVGTLAGTPNPLNVSGLNRGWLSIGAVDGDADSTFDGLSQDVVTFLSTPITIRAASNVEVALAAKKVGSASNLLFIPTHDTATTFLRPGYTFSVVRDGRPLTMGSATWVKTDKLVASGKYYGRHTDDPTYAERLCDLDLTHTITLDGIRADVDILWVRDCLVDGYSAMLPTFGTQVETDHGETLAVPPSDNVILPGAPYVSSVRCTKPGGTVDEQKVWTIIDWTPIDEITRPLDTTNRRQLLGGDAVQWIAPTGKIYNQIWGSSATPDTVVAGTRQGWTVRVAAGYF